MESLKNWTEAFRLRTLPLAAATVLVGAVPAVRTGLFNWAVFLMVLFTTFCLQILSNLANDYGDYSKGTDNSERLGPERTVQGGRISPGNMKRMIFVFVALSLISGILTLYISLGITQLLSSFLMLIIGGGAIWAAIKYTVGKNAFGYKGMGDLFVFIFFGLVGVLGTSYLLTGNISYDVFILSFTPGLFAVGVLNVNNLRDEQNDRSSGKVTLVVRNGLKWGKNYHLFLLICALSSTLLYFSINQVSMWNYLVFLLLPLFVGHVKSVLTNEGKTLDSQLKVLSLSSFLFSLSMLLLGIIF